MQAELGELQYYSILAPLVSRIIDCLRYLPVIDGKLDNLLTSPQPVLTGMANFKAPQYTR